MTNPTNNPAPGIYKINGGETVRLLETFDGTCTLRRGNGGLTCIGVETFLKDTRPANRAEKARYRADRCASSEG